MRFHRPAVSAYLIVTLSSIVLGLVLGTTTPAWLVTMWEPPGEGVERHSLLPVLGGLLLLGLVNAWMLWQVLRGPAPSAVPMRRTATWLRLLLYASVVWTLIPFSLPEPVGTFVGPVLWGLELVLFTVVLTGSGLLFRLATLLLGLVGTAGSLAIVLADDTLFRFVVSRAEQVTVVVAGVAAFAGLTLLLLAQRRDGRWSRATLLIGAGTFASVFLMGLVDALTSGGPAESIAEKMDVLFVVWLARTAHELSRAPRRKAPLRIPVAVAAAAAVLPLTVIGPEGRPHLTYTWQNGQSDAIAGWQDDSLMGRPDAPGCSMSWEPPRVADTPAHERELAYVCTVNKPGRHVSDQELLARGRDACARFAAGKPVRARPALLALLCPEVIGRRHPDLLLSSAQIERRRAEIERRRAEQERTERERLAREARKEDALCRDPWPALRTRFQATASYYDWDGMPYGIHDAEADTEAASDAIWKADPIGLLETSGPLALIFTPAQDWVTCVTAKALRSAPPPPRRKGWDKVVEADVVSGSGRLLMQRLSASRVRFPDLARGGPGTYRLRLYTRPGTDLILVYPVRRAM
ncbi:hypothetical protein ACLQ2R_30155 [Streptosporangium sp. DT93]|uniref:hypothetical protein n=1 Tax=Streptosporangium sp. DT93 TaxID=3393428 RepID=UPI003CE791F7